MALAGSILVNVVALVSVQGLRRAKGRMRRWRMVTTGLSKLKKNQKISKRRSTCWPSLAGPVLVNVVADMQQADIFLVAGLVALA